MVDSLGEDMCVTSGMTIASLVNISFFQQHHIYIILTRNWTLRTFYAIPNIIASNKHPPPVCEEGYVSNKRMGIY